MKKSLVAIVCLSVLLVIAAGCIGKPKFAIENTMSTSETVKEVIGVDKVTVTINGTEVDISDLGGAELTEWFPLTKEDNVETIVTFTVGSASVSYTNYLGQKFMAGKKYVFMYQGYSVYPVPYTLAP